MPELKYIVSLKDGVSAVLGRIRSGFGVLGAGIKNFVGGAARMLVSLPALIGGSLIGAAIGKAIKDFGAQEDAALSLAGALRVAGDASAQTHKRLMDFSAALQATTRFGDEAVQAVMALGLNLGVPADKIEAVTKAAIGLAEKTGMDLNAAMMLFGRTAAGGAAQLSRYGIIIDETASHEERLNQMIRIGTGYFSLAEDKAGTTAGKFIQLRNALGDLRERFGEAIVRIFGVNGALDRLKAVINGVSMERIFAGFARVRQVASVLGSVLGWLRDRIVAVARSEVVGLLVNGLKTAAGIVQSLVAGTTSFGAVLGQLGTLLGASIKVGAIEGVNFLASALQAVVAGVTSGFMALPKVLKSAFNMYMDPSFWSGLAQVIIGSLASVGEFLIKIFTAPLDLVQAGMDTIMKGMMNWLAGLGGDKDEAGVGRVGRKLGLGVQENDWDKNLAEARANSTMGRYAKDAADAGTGQVKEGMAKLAGATKEYRATLVDAGKDAGRAMADEFARSDDLFDASASRKDLADAAAAFGKYGESFKLPDIPAYKLEPPKSSAVAGDFGAVREAKKELADAGSRRSTSNMDIGARFDWLRDVSEGRSPDEEMLVEARKMRELLDKIAKAEGVK